MSVAWREIDHFCSMDWGYNAPGVVLWWACLLDGHYHIRREYKFQGKSVDTVADEIKKITRDLGIKVLRYCVADPAMWQKTGAGKGESIAETLIRRGIPMRKGDNDRFNGWQRCHELLQVAPDGEPWLTIDPSCKYGIRTVPAQMRSKSDPEDVDTSGDDHWCDAWRYGAMSRPVPSQKAGSRPLPKKSAGALMAALSAPEVAIIGADNVR